MHAHLVYFYSLSLPCMVYFFLVHFVDEANLFYAYWTYTILYYINA